MSEFMNVSESWPLYDTIIVCSELIGAEANASGWFTSFAQFAARQDHSLFKTRSEASAGLMYCNQQSQDRTDFAYRAMSLGLRFFAPADLQEYPPDNFYSTHPGMQLNSAFWRFDLPHHVGVEFRVGQDVKLASTAYRCPAGYGTIGTGATMGADSQQVYGELNKNLVFAGGQGVPDVSNRFVFKPDIAIPRNETIEVKLLLSDYARRVLAAMTGPGNITSNYWFGEGFTNHEYPARYGIQCSLWGVREVQQRGQLHI